MPFDARVYQVFLAWPSDTETEREVLRSVIGRWNDLHAVELGVVLLPVGWETHTVPQLGESPQALINRQVLERCDLLIGVFWTRLGTPTETAPSGTVEEIRRFVAAGKWALVYFSNRPAAPELLDPDQLNALKQFREELQSQGLIDRYASFEELSAKAYAALVRAVREIAGQTAAAEPPAEEAPPTARLVARVETEREQSAVDARGRVSYRSRNYLIVTNTGARDARDVSVELAGPVGRTERPPQLLEMPPAEVLPPGASLRYLLMVSLGTSPLATVIMRFTTEDGQQHETRQTLTIY
jgi:hypothetical protein